MTPTKQNPQDETQIERVAKLMAYAMIGRSRNYADADDYWPAASQGMWLEVAQEVLPAMQPSTEQPSQQL